MKKCIDCGRQYKPTNNVQKRCVECGKAHYKAYDKIRMNTPERKAYEKARKQKPAYRAYEKARNKTLKRRSYMKSYQKTPKRKAYNQYYARLPERVDSVRKYQKKYQKIYTQKRLAAKKSLPSTFTIEDWRYAIKYFHNSCVYCGEYSQNLHQEHFIPVVRGGGYTPDNIVPACKRCNSRKHAKTARDFLEEIGHVEKYEIIVSYLQSRHR